jgi:hypothetical protein
VIKAILELFCKTMYGIPLKWESFGELETIWGESSMHVENGRLCGMVVKGVQFNARTECYSWWNRWVDRWSPNARLVLRSLVPAIVQKSILYSITKTDITTNIAALARGLGYKKYPQQWWWGPMRNKF